VEDKDPAAESFETLDRTGSVSHEVRRRRGRAGASILERRHLRRETGGDATPSLSARSWDSTTSPARRSAFPRAHGGRACPAVTGRARPLSDPARAFPREVETAEGDRTSWSAGSGLVSGGVAGDRGRLGPHDFSRSCRYAPLIWRRYRLTEHVRIARSRPNGRPEMLDDGHVVEGDELSPPTPGMRMQCAAP